MAGAGECGVTWLCNADAPPSGRAYLCDDAAVQFWVDVPEGRRIDEGFGIEVRREVEVEVEVEGGEGGPGGRMLAVEVTSGGELRRGRELVVAKEGCEGKCAVELAAEVVLQTVEVRVL